MAGGATLAVEAAVLDALNLLLRFHEITVDAAEIRHQYGDGPFGIAEILRCAKQFRLEARAISTDWDRLPKPSLPAVAATNVGQRNEPQEQRP